MNMPEKAGAKPPINLLDYMREQTSLDEGYASLSIPSKLSKDSIEDLEYWFGGLLVKLKRRAQQEQIKDRSEGDQ